MEITEEATEQKYLLTFSYDANGLPMTVDYDGTVYYYVTNLQGDVIAITNFNGQVVVEYTYDAWGNPLAVSGSDATTLGIHNPLRYRGYVYDSETNLYYLQSRYYDAEIGRFVNGDDFTATGQGFIGNNMFAYCNNNPVIRHDITGEIPAVIIAGAVAALVSGVFNAVNTACSGGSIQDCLIAGAVGMVGGAVGFLVAFASGFSPIGNVAARATATIISDLGTSFALNGEITTTDFAHTAVDVTLDVCFSPIVYHYNPVESLIPQTAINAVADGVIDLVETGLYTSRSTSSVDASYVKRMTFMERRLAR